MNTFSLRVKYRPLRIGWCLKDGDIESLRKALMFSHTMWGGRYNPIIPVDDIEFAKQLVKLFRVDVLIPLSDDASIKSFIDQFFYLHNPLWGYDLFVKERNGNIYPKILDLRHPINLLYNEHFKNNPDPQFNVHLYEWKHNDPLSDMFLATFGLFPSTNVTGIDYGEMIERLVECNRISISEEDEIPKDFFLNITPNWISSYKLEAYHSNIDYYTISGIFIGDATKFEDILTYWNLRATHKDLFFYDPNHSQRLIEFRDFLLEHLRARIKKHKMFERNINIWCNDRDLDLVDFGKDILKHYLSPVSWNGLNIKVPMMHFGEKTVLANFDENSNKPSFSFLLPEKPIQDELISRHQKLIASIDFGSGLFHNETQTIMTPFLPELNEYYGRNIFFRWDRVRVEPSGFGIIIESFQDDLILNALDISSLITKIFELAGISAKHSNAGLVNFRLIQQMGGLQGCRVFKITGVRELIEKYNPNKSFTRSDANRIIGQLEPTTGKPDFKDFEDLYIESRPIGTKLKPENALIFLFKQNVFRVGLELNCPNCQLDFWIAIDDVNTYTTCELCGSNFNITPQLKDRDWRYRRSGIFGKDDNQLGGIPVALTLQQLDTVLSSQNFIYTTALDLESDGTLINKCETDFIILNQQYRDNKIQIAIGECKNKNEITDADVNNLLKVAQSLEKIGIDTYVIFSKLSDFTEDELDRCNIINDEYHRRLILLTQRELEPYFIYEKTAEEFDIDQHSILFEDMVEVTETGFYQKRLKQSNK